MVPMKGRRLSVQIGKAFCVSQMVKAHREMEGKLSTADNDSGTISTRTAHSVAPTRFLLTLLSRSMIGHLVKA